MSPRLAKSINSSIEHNTFPDSAKIALVIKLDKGKPNKNGILNFRSVSILNTFLKANYFMGMGNVFSPQISAYRKNYNSQHILIRLIEQWREYLDKNFGMYAVFDRLVKSLCMYSP